MVSENDKKRQRQDGYKRRHDRNKFRKTTNATVHRKDLGNGLKGFLFSCAPHHENHCFRDAVLLLGKFCEDHTNKPQNEPEQKEQSLEDELSVLRSGGEKLFTRVDPGVNGAVFLKINDDKIDIEDVVESALREARQTGNAGSRHCIRVLPIYSTCYAKAEDAAKAAMGVVKEHFPKIDSSPVSYAIAFRSRVNNSAKRDDFITAVAAAVEKTEPRYKVNLTKPDVVLLVEVLKTSCCIGVFRHYYELAKMNLREAACPSKPSDSKARKESARKDNQHVTSASAKGKTDKDQTSEATDEANDAHEIKDCQIIGTDSDVKANKTTITENERQERDTEKQEALTNDKADDGSSREMKGTAIG